MGQVLLVFCTHIAVLTFRLEMETRPHPVFHLGLSSFEDLG